MDDFLEKYNLPRLTKEETENLNRPITSNEIELGIKKNYPRKNPRTRWIHCLICQTFREDIIPILLKVFQKIEDEGILPNSFYEASQHHSTTKTRQRPHKKRKLQTNIPDEHRCKNTQQNISKLNSKVHQ